MSVSEEQNTKLFKARRTVVQMLRDRGYSVPDSDIKMTRQQFIEKYGENVHLKRDDLLILCSKGDAPTDQIYVFFPAEVKVGVPMVRNCAKRMQADNVYNAILVVQRALTAPAKAAINEINSYFHMEVFEEAELLTNITEHMFVDKGAHGFMRTHKWHHSIGAFINVEASGTGDLDLVCQSGPGSWPSSVYAQSAIYPMAHSAAQIVPGFRVRIIPVLGTIPAIFRQVMASYVVTQLAGLDVQTEPVVLQFTVFSVLKTIAS